MKEKKAIIALEDGTTFYGESFGYEGETTGEVVFNTSMTGYQEILTDPSYKGQIVTMTYPHIGNYGICGSEDMESVKSHVSGFIVKEYSKNYSNWRAEKSLCQFLKENKIVAIEGIDTRFLVRKIREKGAMKGIISTLDFDKKSLIKRLKLAPDIIKRDLVKEVTSSGISQFQNSRKVKWSDDKKVVIMDFGVKLNILKSLVNVGLSPITVPAKTSFEKILSLKPSGILLSNGPGDPKGVPYAIETVKKLINYSLLPTPYSLPLFGICLGHQILGLASGGRTYKLKFGHHGVNQPIKNLKTGRVEITAENHNFAVDIKTLRDFVPTYINLNDGTCEGMEHKKLPIFSVQFHPEASPGPHDTKYLFEKFANMVKNYAKKN
ncbi:MAG: carbamoyl phosphate synthase small subunit [Elusimicrobia bacterium CG06_land_8_20_14_3_00_38_11]|nr:MAG: carbamoyl phosphate synthase small subunit [Elusimicrobia bacterium CG06_land_8_20_14_3_00_38_11]